jgi:Na+/melibiose symporter-like transporter
VNGNPTDPVKTSDSESGAPGGVLSIGDIHTGQKLVRRFATLNGISVALLMDSMLILYAIRNGLGDAAVATLVSFIHLTMPLMLVGKALIVRIGAARTWGMGWLLRNVSALIMILAPFVPADAPQYYRTAIILIGGFGFAAFRAIGLVGNSPVIGEITTDGDRGRFLSGNWVRATTTQLVALIGVILILRGAPETWVFQAVIGFAATLGIYVGVVLSRVPETEIPRRSAQIPIREVVRRVWHIRRMRKLLFAWAAGFAAYTLIIPFAVIALKNGYSLSDHQALMFTLVTLTGGLTASVVNGVIADRVGPRPLFIIYVIVLGLIALFWSFAPDSFLVIPTLVVFFLGGFSKFGILAVTNHYFLDAAESADRVGSAMLLRVVSGATAGLIGAVLGGGILGWLSAAGFSGVEMYRIFFRVAAAAFLVLIPAVVRIDRLEEWPLSRAVLLLLQPWKIIALWRSTGTK